MLQIMKFLQLGLAIASFAALGAVAHASENQVVPIVGGTSVSNAEVIAKRTVGLFFITTKKENGVCTGSILDDSHILTAAHCVADYAQGLVVFANDKLLDYVKAAVKGGVSRVPQVRLMVSVKQEPGYSGQEGGGDEFNDLAVITFQGGLPAGYQPAKFLSQVSAQAFLKQGAKVTLAGYGITQKAPQAGAPAMRTSMLATAPTPSPKPAQPAPNTLGVGTLRQVDVQFAQFSPKLIDLYVQGQPQHDACSGDSGGPSVVNIQGETYVVGVASRSDCVHVSIYTFVNQSVVAGL